MPSFVSKIFLINLNLLCIIQSVLIQSAYQEYTFIGYNRFVIYMIFLLKSRQKDQKDELLASERKNASRRIIVHSES